MSKYRVTDADGDNPRDIVTGDAYDAACEYAELWECDCAESADGMTVIVDGSKFRITVEWNPVYYAVEVTE